MNFGEKIKRIRLFRGMTQRELGRHLGFGESSADVRIAQYESGDRKPKQATLQTLTDILGVSIDNFVFSSPEVELVQLLSWLEEAHPESVRFCAPDSEKDSEKQIASVGIYFTDKMLNEYLMGWMEQKKNLQEQKISQEEYKEWKWNELTREERKNN